MSSRARRRALAIAFAAVLLTVGLLALRDSALVAVDDVEVTGLRGPDAAAIEAALRDAGRDMTTMNVDEERLLEVTEPFPIVRGLEADGDFPGTLKVRVNPYVPVAALVAGDRAVPVAFDGAILRGTPVDGLPTVRVRTLPGGDRLPEGRAMRAVRVAAAAPAPLRARADRVMTTERGLATTLREGPRLLFGAPHRLAAKWSAAARVLADEASQGATYIDLRVPERPAAGGVPAPPEEPADGAAAAPEVVAPEDAAAAAPVPSTSTTG